MNKKIFYLLIILGPLAWGFLARTFEPQGPTKYWVAGLVLYVVIIGLLRNFYVGIKNPFTFSIKERISNFKKIWFQ